MEFNLATAGEEGSVSSSAVAATSAGAGGVKTFPALLSSLQMIEEPLKRVLHSLSCGKYKILKRIAGEVTASGEKEKEKSGGQIKNSDSFQFNDQFSCQVRVRVRG
jgi:hypothetical protein